MHTCVLCASSKQRTMVMSCAAAARCSGVLPTGNCRGAARLLARVVRHANDAPARTSARTQLTLDLCAATCSAVRPMPLCRSMKGTVRPLGTSRQGMWATR